MATEGPLEELLTPEELEEQWKIPRATQASMRSRGVIPFILIGPRTPRYRRADIEKWLAARVAGHAQDIEPAGPKGSQP